jgi:hypothetical protein
MFGPALFGDRAIDYRRNGATVRARGTRNAICQREFPINSANSDIYVEKCRVPTTLSACV